MALHKDFPSSPHAILDLGIRWFLADEALRESGMEKLMRLKKVARIGLGRTTRYRRL
jgi:hypothetical protein